MTRPCEACGREVAVTNLYGGRAGVGRWCAPCAKQHVETIRRPLDRFEGDWGSGCSSDCGYCGACTGTKPETWP